MLIQQPIAKQWQQNWKLSPLMYSRGHNDDHLLPSHVLADLHCAVAAVPNDAASEYAVLPAAATSPSSHVAETTRWMDCFHPGIENYITT